MLSTDEISKNTDDIISLIMTIDFDRFQNDSSQEELLSYLHNTLYLAPASTKYYGSYAGGLAEYLLCVYNNLKAIVKMKGYEDIYTDETLKIVSLGSVLYKCDFYEPYYKNEKVYSEGGYHRDNLGNFDWEAKLYYKVKDNRYSVGTNEETSCFILSKYIKLTETEIKAILNSSIDFDDNKRVQFGVYADCPLVSFLHCATTLSSFVDFGSNE